MGLRMLCRGGFPRPPEKSTFLNMNVISCNKIQIDLKIPIRTKRKLPLFWWELLFYLSVYCNNVEFVWVINLFLKIFCCDFLVLKVEFFTIIVNSTSAFFKTKFNLDILDLIIVEVRKEDNLVVAVCSTKSNKM